MIPEYTLQISCIKLGLKPMRNTWDYRSPFALQYLQMPGKTQDYPNFVNVLTLGRI